MQKGLAPIIAVLIVAFFGIMAAPVLVESEPSPTPTESPAPSPSPTPSEEPTESPETQFHTTVPENQSLDIDKENSQVHIENTGNGSVIRVETSGDGSADVNVQSHIESSTTVSSTSHATLEVSGSSN